MLTIAVFFFTGMAYAGISGAGTGQGLAGGAVVFMYGVYSAVLFLIVAVIFCYYADIKRIRFANRIMAVLLAAALVMVTLRYYSMKGNAPDAINSPDDNARTIPVIAKTEFQQSFEDTDSPMGLGFFKPDFFKNPALYFYGEPDFEKSVQKHSPEDSLVFKNLQQYSNYELVYAPPWLLPEQLKLDYDIFYLKVLSLSGDFAEVELNKQTQKTGYIKRDAGEIIYWPDFLLKVFSVEFPPDEIQKIRFKPDDASSEVSVQFEFMKPLEVKDDWIRVALTDDDFNTVGKGWIRWRRDRKLLIMYSLLS